MERRTAVAASLSMMATVAVGTVAFAALGGIDVLGFGSKAASSPVEIVETSPTTAQVNGEAPPVATTTTLLGEQPGTTIAGESTPTQNGNGTGAVAGPTATTPRATTPGATTPATAAPATAAPTTVAPTTPVTAAPTTVPRTTTPVTSPPPASTLPPGVPKDWPAGVPIPPKPPGCVDGQLEDNGVWNCQD